MPKLPTTKEEVLKLAAKGYTIRVKTRKGKSYISARKDKKEIGLGPYRDELGAIIEGLEEGKKKKKETPTGLKQTRKTTKKITQTTQATAKMDDPWINTIQELGRFISLQKTIHCLHREKDNFCNYWQLSELPESAEQLDQGGLTFFFKNISPDNGKTELWNFMALPGICDHCPAYFDEQTIIFVDDQEGSK